MKITDILTPETVTTELAASGREEAMRLVVEALGRVRAVTVDTALRDLGTQERLGSTLLPAPPYVVAVPHARTAACKQLVIALGLSQAGIPWRGSERAHLVVVILGPPETQTLYLRVMGRIARLLEMPDLVASLLQASTAPAAVAMIAAAEAALGDIASDHGLPSFCVLGAGHGGLAMAAHLALTGCRVNLFNRSAARLEAIQARGGIAAAGAVSGFAALTVVSTDPAMAVDNCDVLMAVIPATGHRDLARVIAPHLRDGQILILNPGRTGGALEVAKTIRDVNSHVHVYLAEAQTLLYAARATNPGQVQVFGIKNSVPLAALPSYQITDILPVIRKVLPQFVPGDNVLKTSLDNIGAVFHPAITVLNAGRIEDTHGNFEYYVEGVTPAIARVLEAIDRERVAVAAALGIRANTAREWLYLAYDAAGKTLHEAMRANAGYTGIQAPGTIAHRYIAEDVPASLVPIAAIGEMLNVPTPAIRAIIQLANVMHGVDYWAEGRTVERLGIKGMSVKEIRFLVVGADASNAPAPGGLPAPKADGGPAGTSAASEAPGGVC